MKKILVTGANGFVGRYLIASLLKDADLMIIGVAREGNYLVSSHERLRYYFVDDINGYNDWSSILQGVEIVIHLAARVHHNNETTDEFFPMYRSVNVEGTKNLAEYALIAGVKKFIFFSTIKVNGEISEKPFSESDIPNPQGHYAVSKWEAEQVLHKIVARQQEMSVVSLRLPLIYGPGVKANFAKLIQCIKAKIPLPFLWINNKRSFLFVGNISEAVKKLINADVIPESLYLLSDNEAVSTSELIRKIGHVLNTKIFLFPFPISLLKFIAGLVKRKNTVSSLVDSLEIDNNRFKEQLNWQPKYSLDEGLKITICREAVSL